MTGSRDDGRTTLAARSAMWGEACANLARIGLPPVGVVSALGLGAAGVALDSAAMGAAGAVAGCVGAGAAWWQSTTVEGRFRTERLRNRDSHRRLQLMIEDLRKRTRVPVEESNSSADLPSGATPLPIGAPAAQPLSLDTNTDTDTEGLKLAHVTVPDTVPDVMPSIRPEGAPEISMELPVFTTTDAAVAEGHLAAVVALRPAGGPQGATQTLRIGELERKVYAAIAAQDATKELDKPVADAQDPSTQKAATAD